ncbi:hypothetical protein C8A00DRAFT_29224 [Chaetomidium leptoderma]|uniref:Uncharacterized protein n=1 Tax=Chaetomidium leptoderma TaxID=669021 RepID=A0AAN7A1C0_9PEZI|nr:hypothetical protein C8A00DRAFT_29224 [Chaetomidium leptoderma]
MPAPEPTSNAETTKQGLLKPREVDVKKQSLEDDKEISDRDVLKGLKIICAASADAEFDALVRKKTGLRLRQFLADLQSCGQLSEIRMG